MTSPSIHLRRLDLLKRATAARLVQHAARTGLAVADLADTRLPWYEIRNQNGGDDDSRAEVLIYDEIGGSFGTNAQQFAEDLQQITADTIAVRINSPGGSVFDSVAIYNTLHHHPARIVVYVDSLAASGASIVAMAGDEIIMMPGSQMMIHDASAHEHGQAADMAKMSTFLDRQSTNVAGIYALRGGDAEQWRALMLDETWMFAAEAVELGLADRVEDVKVRGGEPGRDVLARGFDLSGFRYAGRAAAPAPDRRRRTADPAGPAGRRRMVTAAVRDVDAAGTEVRDAARQRAAFYQSRGVAPGRLMRSAVGLPRFNLREQVADRDRAPVFGAKIRAKLVQRNGQDRYHVHGQATVFNTPYDMWDEFGPYQEEVADGALTDSLANGPDVAFLVNHKGLTMARTISTAPGIDPSLLLDADMQALNVDAWLNPKRQDVKDFVIGVDDGDITEMSFAFLLLEGVWSPDYARFRITEADIHRGDVSGVNYGANPHTSIGLRSYEIMRALGELPAGAARAALGILQTRVGGVPSEHATDTPVRTWDADTHHPDPAERREPAAAGRTITMIEALLD